MATGYSMGSTEEKASLKRVFYGRKIVSCNLVFCVNRMTYGAVYVRNYRTNKF